MTFENIAIKNKSFLSKFKNHNLDIMRHRKELIARWINLIPGLDSHWDHWWLEGDGGLILVTSNLSELLKEIENNYGKSLKLNVSRAYHSSNGDSYREKREHIVADFAKDKAYGWHDE